MADRGCLLEAAPLPPEVRESLAELELELSEGERGRPWDPAWDLTLSPPTRDPGLHPRSPLETPLRLLQPLILDLRNLSHQMPRTPQPCIQEPPTPTLYPGTPLSGCPAILHAGPHIPTLPSLGTLKPYTQDSCNSSLGTPGVLHPGPCQALQLGSQSQSPRLPRHLARGPYLAGAAGLPRCPPSSPSLGLQIMHPWASTALPVK